MQINGTTPFAFTAELTLNKSNSLVTWYLNEKRDQDGQSTHVSQPPVMMSIKDTLEISGNAPRGDSDLLSFDDRMIRGRYYNLLFKTDTKTANEQIEQWMANRTSGYAGWTAHTVELSAARYEQLRQQIITDLGSDHALLGEYLETLDIAFLNNLEDIAEANARILEEGREYTRWAKNAGYESAFTPHPLGEHKDFSQSLFLSNTMDLMRQFAQAFFQQFKSGAASAWETTVEYMMRTTQTTSVNKLSFGDFMALEQARSSAPLAANMQENFAAINSVSTAFLSNPNLSEVLRNVLK